VQAGRGGTDVVLDSDRDAEHPLHLVAQRQRVPAEVHRQRHRAGVRVDPAGDADAEGRQVAA
jgi:hypothetical protein